MQTKTIIAALLVNLLPWVANAQEEDDDRPPPPPAAPQRLTPLPQFKLRPQPSHIEMQPRWGLVMFGAGTLGVSYLVAAALAYAHSVPELAVPIAGPILATRELPDNELTRMVRFAAMFDTLAQTAGLTMLIVGAVTKKQVKVYDRVSVVPTANSGGAGLAAFGRF